VVITDGEYVDGHIMFATDFPQSNGARGIIISNDDRGTSRRGSVRVGVAGLEVAVDGVTVEDSCPGPWHFEMKSDQKYLFGGYMKIQFVR